MIGVILVVRCLKCKYLIINNCYPHRIKIMNVLIDDLLPSTTSPIGSLGGAQEEIFFSVMKVIHRQAQPQPAAAKANNLAPRLSCCCRISELMPLVRQLHDDARARAEAHRGEQRQQAA